jgi:GTP:adenosylcobinamide-phosphate guanylyltransferase
LALRDAILPAGGRLDTATALVAGTDIKALVRLGSDTILNETIEALRRSGRVRKIVVIGPPEVLAAAKAAGADAGLEEGATGPDNIFRGVDHLADQTDAIDGMLVVTTDLPFLTSEIVCRYLDLCPPDKQFCVPLISKTAFQNHYPGATATFVGFRDGEWTAGCMYAASVSALRRARPHIERVFEQRKSKLGMARLLGFGFVVGYLFKTLSIEDVQAKIRSLLDCDGAAVPESPPELAYDIDDFEDYEYAVRHIALRETP